MRKLLIVVLNLLNCFVILAQENKESTVSIDFIISIDGEIAKSISKPIIEVLNFEEGSKSIPVSYHPGNLSLKEGDWRYLLETDSQKLFFKFDSYQYNNKGNQETVRYEFEIDRAWMDKSYFILYIYNTDRKPYKGKLKPLDDKNYTFELEYPGGQMIRLRKP